MSNDGKINAVIFGFGEAIGDYIAKLLALDPIALGSHIVASTLIIGCIVWWFWKPTNAFIDRYKNNLRKTHRELTVANRETCRYLKLLKRENQNLIDLQETAKIKVKRDAVHIIAAAKEEARMEALAITDAAITKTKALEETAHSVIKNSLVQLSIDLTKKLVIDNVNEANSKKIIDSYIQEIESKSITNDLK